MRVVRQSFLILVAVKVTSYSEQIQKKHLAIVHKCSKSVESTGDFNSTIFDNLNSWAQRVMTSDLCGAQK